MPNCPFDGHRLAFFPEGGLCPRCRREFTVAQVIKMPGYDVEEVMEDAQYYILLDSLGLLENGVTAITQTPVGLFLEREYEPD